MQSQQVSDREGRLIEITALNYVCTSSQSRCRVRHRCCNAVPYNRAFLIFLRLSFSIFLVDNTDVYLIKFNFIQSCKNFLPNRSDII